MADFESYPHHSNRNRNHLVRFASGSIAVAFVFLAAARALPSVDAISGGGNAKNRGKVLGEHFDEHDLLRAFEEIKEEYHEKAFGSPEEGGLPADDLLAWKLLVSMNPHAKRRYLSSRSDDDHDHDHDRSDEIIKVSLLKHPSDPLCPYVKMETVVPVPVEKCWDFLSLHRWDENMPKMDPFYEGLDIYGEYSIRRSTEGGIGNNNSDVDDGLDADVVKMILARKRTKRILAFGKREFVFVSVEDTPLEDGTWVSGSVSVEVPELDDSDPASTEGECLSHSLRRNKSYTRGFQDSIAFYKPLPATSESGGVSRTKCTIICRIDLNDSSGEHGSGGCIPMWLYVKTIGITGARFVLGMRKCLLEEAERE